jgi:VIT1/CCC1 family predicted Fe2+/Mn2+ transporter
MGLIIGLGAAQASTATIVSGLLIIGLADNMTDSLSIHMYQEAERLEERSAFRATTSNFVARILTVLGFVAIVLLLPQRASGVLALAWGCLLLAAIRHAVARARGASPLRETTKHLGVAALVIIASRLIGEWILAYVHSRRSKTLP